MAIMAISVAPAGLGKTGMSEFVAKALDVLAAEPRIEYEIGPMFTTIQGELSVLMEVAQRMHESIFEAGADRVGTVIKIDDRRDADLTMDGKLESVHGKMNS